MNRMVTQEINGNIETQRREMLRQIDMVKGEFSQHIQATEKNIIEIIEEKEERRTEQVNGLTQSIKESMKQNDEKPDKRAQEQTHVNTKILQLLRARNGEPMQPSKVVVLISFPYKAVR